MTCTFAYIPRLHIDDAILLGWLPRASAGPWSVFAEWLCGCPAPFPRRALQAERERK